MRSVIIYAIISVLIAGCGGIQMLSGPSKEDLYKKFVVYCQVETIPLVGKETFGRQLKNSKNVNVSSHRAGLRGAQTHGWKGIKLK